MTFAILQLRGNYAVGEGKINKDLQVGSDLSRRGFKKQ